MRLLTVTELYQQWNSCVIERVVNRVILVVVDDPLRMCRFILSAVSVLIRKRRGLMAFH